MKNENDLKDYAVTICDACIALKGEMCDEPGCIFIRYTMSEVEKFLNMMMIRPTVDGKPLYIADPIIPTSNAN